MGLFDKMKDSMAQAQEAASQAQQVQSNSGMSGLDVQGGLQARGEMEALAHESNRILGVGAPGTATIKGHVDTGEQVAGNAVWILDVEVAPEGGAAYTVQKREIVPAITMSGYADGTTMPCRIDPADQNKIAFGEKPFM
jgi:hypothetical protein